MSGDKSLHQPLPAPSIDDLDLEQVVGGQSEPEWKAARRASLEETVAVVAAAFLNERKNNPGSAGETLDYLLKVTKSLNDLGPATS